MDRIAPLVAFLNRHATLILALSAGLGLIFPSVASIARPTLPALVFVLLAFSFLQVEPAALAKRLRSPKRALLAVGWMILVMPALALGSARLLGLQTDPDLMLMLFLITASSPLISAPTFAGMMGLDAALMLAIVLLAIAAVPLTAPGVAAIFIDADLPLSPLDLAIRLAIIVGVSFTVATLARRVVGPVRLKRARPFIDGAAILVLIWFAIAAMDGIRAAALSDPALVAGLAVFAYALALGQMGLTYIVFRSGFGPDAGAVAYGAGNRNIGLLIVALGVMALPDRVWYFFAVVQLPIFTLPLVLKRLIARGARRPASSLAAAVPPSGGRSDPRGR